MSVLITIYWHTTDENYGLSWLTTQQKRLQRVKIELKAANDFIYIQATLIFYQSQLKICGYLYPLPQSL